MRNYGILLLTSLFAAGVWDHKGSSLPFPFTLTRRFLHFPRPAIPPPPFMALRMFSDRGRGEERSGIDVRFLFHLSLLLGRHMKYPFFPPLSAMLCVHGATRPLAFLSGKTRRCFRALGRGGAEGGRNTELGRGPPGAAGREKGEKKVGSLFSLLYPPPSASVSSPGNKGLLHPS